MPQPVVNEPDKRLLQRRVCVCPIPIDATGNASYDLTFTGSNLTQIDMTLNGVTYRRSLTYSSGMLDTVSTWSEV